MAHVLPEMNHRRLGTIRNENVQRLKSSLQARRRPHPAHSCRSHLAVIPPVIEQQRPSQLPTPYVGLDLVEPNRAGRRASQARYASGLQNWKWELVPGRKGMYR